MTQNELTTYLNKYLDINNIKDSSWNGLQVQGQDEISKISFAVDACQASFQATVQWEAEYLITHHGIFWTAGNPSLVGWQKNRVSSLLKNNTSLYAAHLPLDCHPEVGNNAELIRILGGHITGEFHLHNGRNIGWIADFDSPQKIVDIKSTLDQKLGCNAHLLSHGPSQIKTIAVLSGAGGHTTFYDALNANVDLYITGEQSDIFQASKDAGINVIFAGHYATETVGLKALADHLKNQFNIPTSFIDAPTNL